MRPLGHLWVLSHVSLNCVSKGIIRLTTNTSVLSKLGNTGPICHDVITIWIYHTTWSIFTKQTDVLPQDFMKCWSRKIGCYNNCVVLQCGGHFGNAAAKVSVKFQSDWKSLNLTLSASRLHKFLVDGKTPIRLVNRSPSVYAKKYNHYSCFTVICYGFD